MNRTERRNKEKADKKNNNKTIEAMKWINSLAPEKLSLIKDMLNIEAKKEQKAIIGAIEMCYTAGIIDILEDDITIKQIEKIMERCSDLLAENSKKVNELKHKCRGDYEMAIKSINAIANEVANRMQELIYEGVDTKELKIKISLEYPTLSKAAITNSLKRVKEDIKQREEENKRAVAEAKLLDILEEKQVKVVPEENILEAKESETILEESEVIPGSKTIIDEVVEEFKILKEVRILDIEGKHGTYHIEKNVMQVGEKSFCNILDVENWASDEIGKLAIQIESIKSKEKESIRVLEKFM